MEKILSEILNEVKDSREEMQDVKVHIREVKSDVRKVRKIQEVNQDKIERLEKLVISNKEGIDILRNEVQTQMKELRNEVQTQMEELKNDLQSQMEELKNDLQSQMEELKNNVQTQTEGLRKMVQANKEAIDVLMEITKSIERVTTSWNNDQIKSIRHLMLMEKVNVEKDKMQDRKLAVHHKRITKCEEEIVQLAKN